jgi:putative acetyltransferase
MDIRLDDLRHPDVVALLQEHARVMHEVSPPDSCHVLDLDGLRQPDITFWSVWDGAELAGCGALKELDARHGEIKSMRATARYLRRGVGRLVLDHILAEATRRGYARLSLETGSQPYFEPARRLYAKLGFAICPPFGSYKVDPHSTFMTRTLP